MGITTARHRRALVTLPVGAALIATALVGLPAAHAGVTGPIDCPEPLPTADAVKGLTGTGYTVSSGTQPEAFTATVLGRITNGIGPGVDMIMAELDSPALDAAGGVWSGMSGSPVYTDDGHLIGAVSYGLAASSPIAGITPAQTMTPLLTGGTPTPGDPDDGSVALSHPATKVRVTGAQAQALAKVSGLGVTTTSRGFSQLALPLGISATPSKAGQKLLDRFEKKLGAKVTPFNGAGKAVAALDAGAVGDVHAGGNFAGVLAYGDSSVYGVGTTTFVCRGRAVAFGHPFFYDGDATMGANLADTVLVQPDPLGGPFKVTNITDTVGTVNLDSLTGIAGTLGAAPTRTIAVTTKIKNSAGRIFRGKSAVVRPDFTADVAATTTLTSIQSALGASSKGSGRVLITINGKRANGSAFTVTYKSAIVDRYDVAFATADIVYGLTGALTDQDLEDITLTSINVSAQLSKRISAYKASRLEIHRDGAWHRASQGPFLVRSKSTLTTRVALTHLTTGASKYLKVKVKVPSVPRGSGGSLSLVSGTAAADWDFSDAASFPALLKELNSLPVANGLYAVTMFPTDTSVRTARSTRLITLPLLAFGDSMDLYAP